MGVKGLIAILGLMLATGSAFGQYGQQLYGPVAPPISYVSGPAGVVPVDFAQVTSPATAVPATPPMPPGTPAAPAAGIADAGCATVSPSCCPTACCRCCCANMFNHETDVFVDYLYLRPFGIDMPHGFQNNGTGGAGAVPFGDVGVVTPEFGSGVRIGGELALCCDAGIRATFTDYSTSSSNTLLQPPPSGQIQNGVGSLVLNPGTATAQTATFSRLDASYGLQYRFGDLDYSLLIDGCERHAVNWDIGVRYAHSQQNFEQVANFTQGGGVEDTTAFIRFDGVGLRSGFDGQWQLGCSRISAYGWGFLNVLFGEYSGRYQQFDTTTTSVEAASNWSDDRCVPILDYEVGLKWTSCNGHLVLGTGYYTAFWFNTDTTPDFIRATQTNDFNHVDRTMAITGLTTHAEFRF